MLLLALALLAASWLDGPLTQWNTPGAAVPMAPPTTNPDLRCRTSEVAPSTPEDSMLAANGWRLESFWPAQTSGSLYVRTALAEYDGMCRPFEFNVFVFSNGQFAGTLSPVRMLSRFDGALFGTPTTDSPTSLRATFVRYADTDPLCCPSRGTSTVTYALQSGVVVALQTASAPAQVPSRLPATGSAFPDFALPGVLAGLFAIAIGVVFRRRMAR
jgi:hypothetical protein